MVMILNEEELLRTLDEYRSFVRKIAYTAITSSPSIDVEDLCQVGDLAILRAVRSYDPTCGRNIKSYICSCIRQDIYNEAARFLGIFTVDHKVTEMGAKIVKMDAEGKSYKQIADILNERYPVNNWTEERVFDTKLAYSRRSLVSIEHEPEISEEVYLKEFLLSLVCNDTEKFILLNRILGKCSAQAAAVDLQKSVKDIYAIESALKQRIMFAIKNII